MHDLYALKDKLVKELEEFGHKDLSESSLKTIDTLAHAAKNVAKIIECCEDEEYSNAMGYSRRGYSRKMASYDDGGSYANNENYPYMDFVRPDGSYRDGGMSYARGRGRGAKRDVMSRYASAGDEITMKLEELMDKAPDERTKNEIRKLIDKM